MLRQSWRRTSCGFAIDFSLIISALLWPVRSVSLCYRWLGGIEEPPYLSSTTTASIREWYLNRGARRVVVKIIDEDEFDEAQARLFKVMRSMADEQRLFKSVEQAVLKDPEWLRNHRSTKVSGGWPAEFRQHYGRHVVYEMTHNHTYTVH